MWRGWLRGVGRNVGFFWGGYARKLPQQKEGGPAIYLRCRNGFQQLSGDCHSHHERCSGAALDYRNHASSSVRLKVLPAFFLPVLPALRGPNGKQGVSQVFFQSVNDISSSMISCNLCSRRS